MQVCESQAIVSVLFRASSIISNKLLAIPFTTDHNIWLSGSQRKWCVRSRFLALTLLILIRWVWVTLRNLHCRQVFQAILKPVCPLKLEKPHLDHAGSSLSSRGVSREGYAD